MYSIVYQVGESEVWKALPSVFAERWQADIRAEELTRKFDIEYGPGFAKVKVQDVVLHA